NETAVLATEYARKELGLTKLILRVFTYNEAAIRSYEHAGFVKIKELPLVECSDGEKSDMILMEQKI
ncbi:MAG: GNAT family N-acetyltransferase, partial [Butyrivibrio sp.]|nr:GNAT family N-acetyltransferase [Butyrivibrio sp.]